MCLFDSCPYGGRIPTKLKVGHDSSFSRRYVSCQIRQGRCQAIAEAGEATYSSTLAACVTAGLSNGCRGAAHCLYASLRTLYEVTCRATAAQRGGSYFRIAPPRLDIARSIVDGKCSFSAAIAIHMVPLRQEAASGPRPTLRYQK